MAVQDISGPETMHYEYIAFVRDEVEYLIVVSGNSKDAERILVDSFLSTFEFIK